MRTNIARRLAALEERVDRPELRPWHQVFVNVGQTEEGAVAAYEAEHGPIGEDNVIVIQFVEPDPSRFTQPIPTRS